MPVRFDASCCLIIVYLNTTKLTDELAKITFIPFTATPLSSFFLWVRPILSVKHAVDQGSKSMNRLHNAVKMARFRDSWELAPMYFDAAEGSLVSLQYSKRGRFLDFVPGPSTLRKMLSILALLAVFSTAAAEAQEPATYDLLRHNEVRQWSRIRAVLEVEGQLKLNADGTGVTSLPLRATSDLLYDERIEPSTQDNPLAIRSLRYYHEADAEVQVGETSEKTVLDEDRRRIVVDCDGNRPPVMYCPTTPLRRADLDLIDMPGSSALLAGLLPNRSVTIGESWRHDSDLLAWFLSIEDVTENGVTSTLTEVTDGAAHIAITGHIDGAVGGVATAIDLEGIIHYDLSSGHIVWLSLSIKEDRSIGHASPGFEITARLRLRAAALEESAYLADATLPETRSDIDSPSAALLLESTASGMAILYSRRWQVMVDRRDVTLLRLIDHGDMIAQLNIATLPDLQAGTQLRAEVFRQQVQAALGDSVSQIIETTEETTPGELHIIRVVAAGVVSELPVQWIYYHVTERTGRRLSCVFTMESNLTERFGVIDQTMIGSLSFIQRDEDSASSTGEESVSARSGDSEDATSR